MFDQASIDQVSKLLSGNKQTIAVAESVTSGFIQAALSTAENASLFFEGGITVYNIRQKFKHLHIDLLNASATNCVSQPVAEKMALEVERSFASDWGISITGYASPLPGHEKNAPYAWYAITFRGNCIACDNIVLKPARPVEVQLEFTNRLLNILAATIQQFQKTT